jgi:hypothetical protein
MVERRSMGEAMTVNQKAVSFIKSGIPGDAVAPLDEDKKSAGDLRPQPEEPRTAETHVLRRGRPRQKSARVRAHDQRPDGNTLLDGVLLPITTRLHHRTVQALRRAYLEQKLNHLEPSTQQEIIEVAVHEWLRRHGYLD